MADDPMEEEKAERPVEEETEAPEHDVEEGEAAPEDSRGNAATPAKAAAEKLIAVAGSIVYKKGVTAELLKIIQKAARPEVGIAQAVLFVMKLVKDAAKNVPRPVIDKMAKPITMMVAELAVKAGLVEDSPELVKMVVSMIQQAIGKASQGGPNLGPKAPNAGPAVPPAVQPQGMIQNQMGA